jgi:protein SCO1
MKKIGNFYIYLTALHFLLLMFGFSCTQKKQGPDQDSLTNSSQAPEISGTSIYNLDLTLFDQYGKKIKWSSLRGKTTVLSMIFTNCTYACPMIVEEMNTLKNSIDDPKNNVQYILISFDSKNDTPEKLLRFSKEKSLNKSWTLLTGNEESIKSLAMALDIKYNKLAEGGFDHSNTIVVLNSQGDIAGRSDELRKGSKELLSVISQLIKEQ